MSKRLLSEYSVIRDYGEQGRGGGEVKFYLLPTKRGCGISVIHAGGRGGGAQKVLGSFNTGD